MDLEQQAVGAGGDGRARHRRNHGSNAGAMGGVGNDWEMRQRLDDRYRAEVQQIPGLIVEAANATLTQNDVGIALCQNILGAEQQLLDRSREASLDENG